MSRAAQIVQWTIGPDVLDVGCAGHIPSPNDPTWLHGALRKSFDNVWGIELDPDLIQALSQAGYDNIVEADAQSFELDRLFNTVVAGEIIEHLENPAGLLQSAKRHLKPGGKIVLTTPFPFGLLHYAFAMLRFPTTCSNPQHTLWLCPTTLNVLAQRVQLRVAHWELLTDYPTHVTSRWYRLLRVFVQATGRILPKRLSATTMLVVLVPSDDA
jgi:2-polyprenyl-3-methyl-5-hydroxy-6-metoxy-1,4-benzoquinol methylase